MSEENQHDFTDRYEGLMPYPDPETMCEGECEGMGVYPLKSSEGGTGGDVSAIERRRWLLAHFALNAHIEERPLINLPFLRRLFTRKVKVACNGWHFITCPDCEGTGKTQGTASPSGAQLPDATATAS